MYNHVIHRFTPAAVRGIVIQPKVFNVGDPQYGIKAKALIHGLRAVFGRDDLPVCFVQMHSPDRYELREAKDPDDWVRMRDAQRGLAALPHTTVVATYDLKAPGRSEPDVGLRAAQWATAVVKNAAVKTGPIHKTHRADGKRIVVEFENVGQGLMAGKTEPGKPVQAAPGAAPGGFELAGTDGQWHDATAAIAGDTVIVTCDKIERPAAVRYAWSPEPTAANLYNRNGFPALPFAGR
jgi:sialate O-acetylesterase